MNYKKIVFATNNKNKLAEIREMLAGTRRHTRDGRHA